MHDEPRVEVEDPLSAAQRDVILNEFLALSDEEIGRRGLKLGYSFAKK
jgi:hypothetical protein